MLTEDITFINSLHNFEKRGIHYHLLYAWVDAFRDKMDELSLKRVVSFFYQQHGVDNFNSQSCVTEYCRIQKEVLDLQKIRYFDMRQTEDMLYNYQKREILTNMLYASVAAYRTILPYFDYRLAIGCFSRRHAVANFKITELEVDKIKNKIRLLESKDYFDFQKQTA